MFETIQIWCSSLLLSKCQCIQCELKVKLCYKIDFTGQRLILPLEIEFDGIILYWKHFSLGSVQTPFCVASHQYVPERMKKKLNRVSDSVIESGLSEFCDTFSRFMSVIQIQKLSHTEDDQSDNVGVLNVDDLRGPLIFCSYLLILIGLIFGLEIIIHKIELRRK